MTGTEIAWVIPALSASAFFLAVVFGRVLPNQGSFISIGAIFLGFVLFWWVLYGLLTSGPASFSLNWLTIGGTTITWGVVVDRLSVVMLGLVTFVALLVQVYSIGYMKGDPRYGWYFAAHALFAAAMLALVLADNLLFLYIAWELVGLGSYLLIGFWYERRSAAEAAKKAFVTTRIGDVGLLIGIILLYKATGTFDIATIFHVAEQGSISQATLNVSAILIFLGAMGKSAQFPFHVWLPDAMEGPTPVSALIHAATMVAAGVYLVARMLPFFELAPTVLLVVACVGLFTFVFGGSLALVMTDIKRVLAYSTISHLGLMMLSLGALGLAPAIFHLVAHGVSKALLFLGAGSVMHGMRDETNIWKMGGLRRRMPITAIDVRDRGRRFGGHRAAERVLHQGRGAAGRLGPPRPAVHRCRAAGGRAQRALHGQGDPRGVLRTPRPGRRAGARVPGGHDAALDRPGAAVHWRRPPGPRVDRRIPGVRGLSGRARRLPR